MPLLRSPRQTSCPSAIWLMLGMIMPHSPLFGPFFLSFLPSLHLSLHCPISVSLFLSVYLLFSSGGFCGIGQQHCVGGDYVWSADSDLTFSMLSLRLKPALVDSRPPKLPLCSCYFFCCCFNASYAFHREGTSRRMRCGNFPALVIFHDQFVVFSVCVCVCVCTHTSMCTVYNLRF